MSWISDVRLELKALDTSRKSLRNFGLLIGAIFILLAVWFYIRAKHTLQIYGFGGVGLVLFISGTVMPAILRAPYRVWMGFAFGMGWIVSRVILTVLFFLVLFPMGILARLFGKEFMDLNMKKKKDSYWIKNGGTQAPHYDKMY